MKRFADISLASSSEKRFRPSVLLQSSPESESLLKEVDLASPPLERIFPDIGSSCSTLSMSLTPENWIDIPPTTDDPQSSDVIVSTVESSDDVLIVAETETKARGFTLKKLPPHHYYLGDTMFASVSDFGKSLRVHIRKYRLQNGKFYPTKEGITLSSLTFRLLMNEVHFITNCKAKVIGDELFVSSSREEDGPLVRFQRVYVDSQGFFHFAPSRVWLSSQQFSTFQDECDLIWRSIKQMLLDESFKNSVMKYRTLTSQPCDLPPMPTSVLLGGVVRNAVECNIHDLFDCPACHLPLSQQPLNQLGHECCTTSMRDKCKSLFEEAVALLSPVSLGKSFAKESDELKHFIPDDFMAGINNVELIDDSRILLEKRMW